jgi:hypothetical protein
MPNFVQLYKSTDTNAPILTGQSGSLVSLLTMILVNGYTAASVASITRTSNTATVTLAAPNSTLVTGNWVTIAGAAQSDYNGIFQITVIDNLTFTYTVANTPVTPATGTITYAKSGLQWTCPFSSGNTAVYRSADNTSNQFYLQVIDNAATAGGGREAQVTGYESMTSATVGTRPFPNLTQKSLGLCVRKSTTADSTVRAWTLIGDDRTFYLITATGDTSPFHMFSFGHFITFKSNDGFNTFICAEPAFNSGTTANALCTFYTVANGSIYLARNFAGLATDPASVSNITVPYVNGSAITAGLGSGMALPNPPDTGYYVLPFYIYETYGSFAAFRGRFPGIYVPMQNTPLTQYDTMTNVSGLSGVTLTAVSISNTNSSVGQLLFDTFGSAGGWN